MAAEVFIQRFPVDAADIDELGHVNNIVYLRYAQEIAIAHWRARASPEMIATYVWVVMRHEVDYRAALKLGDEVEVRTWVDDQARGPAWARFVEIYKAGAEKPSAQIKSNWCLLDAQTRRIRRVPPDLVERFV
ncbi:MAG TPA: thioesterase family protein [Vitreimonas sp.]|uniref:acyl-CoA thioesterase n=1 Tax=Vitreimonas sp. TaxID=3069702 RepID=UPI002D3EBBD9|nr:thioesterase family protein [Vitreimonas sp.]HYD88244.1 thioesterase family protein [Vitreimonas sp.]